MLFGLTLEVIDPDLDLPGMSEISSSSDWGALRVKERRLHANGDSGSGFAAICQCRSNWGPNNTRSKLICAPQPLPNKEGIGKTGSWGGAVR